MNVDSLLLDVNPRRVAFQGTTELSWGEVIHGVPMLVLDTGCTMAVLAPAKDIDSRTFPGDYWVEVFKVVGGVDTSASVFKATLRIGKHEHPVEVWVVEGQDDWLLGLPVLCKYNLILRNDDARGPRLETGPNAPPVTP